MAAPKTTAAQRTRKSIVKNRRASFDYAIEETYEAGLVLMGGEVKSLRAGKSEIVDAWVSVDNGEAWLKQMAIFTEHAEVRLHDAVPHLFTQALQRLKQ